MGFRPMQLAGERGRLPEQGRIRLGKRGEKFPTALKTFRLTSADRSALDRAATIWGGEVTVWENEWQLITEASEIEIVLPHDPLGGTPIYELWGGASLQRRCDGEMATVPRRVGNQPDDVEYDQVPCVCNARKLEECKPKTRLSVILPQLPFGGTWRMETGSWNAAEELPGMVETIEAVAQGRAIKAVLAIREEEKVVAGKTKKFIVPTLRMAESLAEAITGVAALGVLEAAPPVVAAIEAAKPVDDDEPVEGEVVDDESELMVWLDQLRANAAVAGIDATAFAAVCRQVGLTEELSNEGLRRVQALVNKVEVGTHTLTMEGETAVLQRKEASVG